MSWSADLLGMGSAKMPQVKTTSKTKKKLLCTTLVLQRRLMPEQIDPKTLTQQVGGVEVDQQSKPGSLSLDTALAPYTQSTDPALKPWWYYHPIVLSATQIDTWDLCQRKWGWSYIDGIKGSNAFAQRGIAIDEILNAWLEKGTPIDGASEYGKMIIPGLKYLPVPGTPQMFVQREFHLKTDVATYFGKKDVEFIHPETKVPVVLDNKTTTDFRWAKTEEDLKSNTQAVLYAAEALDHFKVDQIELNWVYYRTRGAPASHRVTLRVFREEIIQQMDRIDNIAKDIIEAYKTVTAATDLPVSPQSCEAFGGCIYKEHCNLSPVQKMRALMAQETQGSSLLDKLKAKNGAASAPAAAAAVAPAPAAPVAGSLAARLAAKSAAVATSAPVAAVAPVAPVAAAPVAGSLAERLAAKAAAQAPAPPAAVAQAPAADAPAEGTLAERIAARKAQNVNPPPVEAQAIPPAPQMPPPPVPVAPAATNTVAAPVAPVAAAVAPAAATEAPKAKRGRPKGSTNAGTPAVAAGNEDVSHAQATPESLAEAVQLMSMIAEAAAELRVLGIATKISYEF